MIELTDDKRATALEQVLKYKTIQCRVSHSFAQNTYKIEVDADGRDEIIAALTTQSKLQEDNKKPRELLERYKSMLDDVQKEAYSYAGCRCQSGENDGMGNCWPCRMMSIGGLATDYEELFETEETK